MATGIRACFGSCLSSAESSNAQNSKKKEDNACISAVKSFFTDPKNHLARYMLSTEGRDKALKFADPLFDLAGEIAKAAGASERAIEGIEKGRSWAKTGRDIYAIFNIFAGVIAGLVEHLKNFFFLMKSLVTPGDHNNVRIAHKGKSTDYAVGTPEKILAAGANFGKGTAAAAYIFGFGVCRPIANIHKHIRGKDGKPLIEMGEGALKLGQAFSTVMMINHIGALVGGGCEIGYQYFAFNRASQASSNTSMNEIDQSYDDSYDDFQKSVKKNLVGVLEKFLELIHDIVTLIGQACPAWFRLPVTFGIGFFGCYKQWRETA